MVWENLGFFCLSFPTHFLHRMVADETPHAVPQPLFVHRTEDSSAQASCADLIWASPPDYWTERKWNFPSAHSIITPVSLDHHVTQMLPVNVSRQDIPTHHNQSPFKSCFWLLMLLVQYLLEEDLFGFLQESHYLFNSSEITPLLSTQRFWVWLSLIIQAIFTLFCTHNALLPWSKIKGGRVSRTLFNHFL